MTEAVSTFGSSRIPARFVSGRVAAQRAAVSGLPLVRPVYWIVAGVLAGVAFHEGGIAAMTLTVAASIALWAFGEPRSALWLTSAFMIFLFVFFQDTAPLGEDLPAEFLFWGIGLAMITAGLVIATLFSSQIHWALAKKRFATPVSTAMFAMLLVIIAATVYGLLAGNSVSIVSRQLFGCILLPTFYFISIILFRSPADVRLWLARVSWVVTLGSLWYAQKLSFASAAHGYYFREQSPLVTYAGAIAVIALCEFFGRRGFAPKLASVCQLTVCLMAIVLMGSRSTLGSLFAAIAALGLLLMWKRHVVVFALVVCLLPIFVGVAPYLSAQLMDAPGLTGQIAGRFIFVLDQDQSYLGRVAQTEVVLDMVNRHPLLGAGIGSENSFVMPDGRRLKVASVDNGWGYVLLKMGYVGLVAFVILMALAFKRGLSGLGSNASARAQRVSRFAVVATLFYALVTFVSGPTFFHFFTAPFVATLLGALVVLSEPQLAAPASPQTGAAA